MEAVPVAGGLLLRIRPRFHHHTPQQLSTFLAFHQQAADEFGATCSAGRAKNDWGSAGMVVVAMGVASSRPNTPSCVVHYSRKRPTTSSCLNTAEDLQ